MNIRIMMWRVFVAIAVTLISLAGCGSGGGNNAAGTVSTTVTPDQTPTKIPDIPVGVSVVGGTNKATISWDTVSGASSYNIYWATTPGVTQANGTRISCSSNTFIHRGLQPSAHYYYIVTAQNSSGESAASQQVSAVTAVLDGSAPYGTYCAICHGQLATSAVTNFSVSEITAALQNINAMKILTLTASQIAAISAALMFNN
jgi:predicted phage tail protein